MELFVGVESEALILRRKCRSMINNECNNRVSGIAGVVLQFYRVDRPVLWTKDDAGVLR